METIAGLSRDAHVDGCLRVVVTVGRARLDAPRRAARRRRGGSQAVQGPVIGADRDRVAAQSAHPIASRPGDAARPPAQVRARGVSQRHRGRRAHTHLGAHRALDIAGDAAICPVHFHREGRHRTVHRQVPYRRVGGHQPYARIRRAGRHGEALRRGPAVRPTGKCPDAALRIGLLGGRLQTVGLTHAPGEIVVRPVAPPIHREAQTRWRRGKQSQGGRNKGRRERVPRNDLGHLIRVGRGASVAP